jgi:hypothetical protein
VKGPAPTVTEDSQFITIQGPEFSVALSKRTGLIAEGVFRGRKIIEGGPFLNFGSLALSPWWPTGIRHSETADEAVINLAGAYMARCGETERVGAEFEIRIDGQGLVTTQYTIQDRPEGISEIGVAYTLSSSIDRLTWDRDPLWSSYPSDHIGRAQGTALRNVEGPIEAYRTKPMRPWSEDSKDFFLYGLDDPGGRGTNDFRSLKENIWHASCLLAGTDLRVRVESDGSAAVRVAVLPDGRVQLNINNLWGYPDLDWGNYEQPIAFERGYKNSVRMRLTDGDEG